MNLAILSLVALAAAICLGVFCKNNVGIAAIALAYLIGIAGGLSANDVIKGFSASMALTMIGVMYLFAVISGNGTLELLAKKAARAAGKNRWLLYLAMFLIGALLSGVGPGAIPTLAIMPVLAIPVALKTGMNPILLSLIGQMGAQSFRMSPITPEAVVVSGLMTEQGLAGNTLPVMWCLFLTEVAMVAFSFLYFKGWKLEQPLVKEGEREQLGSFNGKQWMSLAGLAVMIIGVVVFRLNVGLISFVVGVFLVVFRCADEKKVIKALPWNTILLVLGVGVLMNIVKLSGGVELLSGAISKVSSRGTISPMMTGTAGVMSLFSSGLGVVFPTLIPTVGGIAEAIPGINAVELMSDVVIGGTIAGFTPISTAGALIVAGISQFPEAEERYPLSKMSAQLCIVSVAYMLISMLMAKLGIYAFVCSMF